MKISKGKNKYGPLGHGVFSDFNCIKCPLDTLMTLVSVGESREGINVRKGTSCHSRNCDIS